MGFKATDHAFEAVEHLPTVFQLLRGHDGELADQMKRAAWSMVLNLEEGTWKSGRDRINRYRIAAGSASEVRASLKLALALGYVDQERIKKPLASLDQVLAILWKICGPR
jgi:four helix bundle protein